MQIRTLTSLTALCAVNRLHNHLPSAWSCRRVLIPEYYWLGLEKFVAKGKGLRGVSDLFWQELWPAMQTRLSRPDKAVVLGTAPFWDESTRRFFNRAPILCEGRSLHQDKQHLTP